MQEETKYIEFRIGDETKHVVEELTDESIKTSLFSEQYTKALSALDNMAKFAIPHKEADNVPNNILSFIGDRGAGKTSCMMSFAKLLEKGLPSGLASLYPQAARRSYHCLERIDPSFFDASHNVIELFLAGLYNAFDERRKQNIGKSDSEKTKQEKVVLELFVQAQTMMSEMTKTEGDRYDALDNLQNLSAGIRLWSVIDKLVKAFFDYFEKSQGMLVLPIDDIDLNSAMAAEMMEQIRKFLIHNNIIILFAVKIDQLELSKRLSLTKEYDVMLQRGLLKNTNVIGEMAEAYITKLLPHQQRIYMPDGTAYFHRPVNVVSKNDNGQDVKDTYSSVRQMILELIYQKTRYLFYNSIDKTSYIVPSNLRELRFLVGLLYNMKDYWHDDNKDGEFYNKLLFRKYLYENWVVNNLDETMQASVREIIETQDNAQVNARVLAAIKRHFLVGKDFTESHPEAEYIFDITNVNYNISVGDVLDIVDLLEESERDTLKLKFLFLIRSFYSMRLYQAYDDMIPDTEQVNDGEGKKKVVEAFTRLSDMHLSEYDKLVAGSFINTRLSRIIPPGRGWKETRAERRINFDKLRILMNEVIAENGRNVDKLRLVEFFMLGISRKFDTRHEGWDAKYRTELPLFYAEPLQQISKNAYFDVGALLYNLTRIKNCYERFSGGDDIYKIADEKKDSLLNQFRMAAISEKAKEGVPHELENFKPAYWRSFCCFRNAEVIQAFRAYAERFESPGGDHINVMAAAFNHMGGFRIPSYDKNKKSDKYYEIGFGYLSIIGEMLVNENISNNFKDIFEGLSDSPEWIEVQEVLAGAAREKNRVDTRIRRIYEHYPVIARKYRQEVEDAARSYGSHASKEGLEKMILAINIALEQYREA